MIAELCRYGGPVLIRFEAANHRSIREPVELSMVAIDREREEAREAPNLGESLLPLAGVYGANASGKSNILAALIWLRDAVQSSLIRWEDEIPVDPFAFAGGPGQPSEFTIELLIDGVRFEYVLELDSERVKYEGLFHYPEKKRRRIFDREDENLRIQRGLGILSGTRELLTPRSLALSIARRFDEPLVVRFAREISRIQYLHRDSSARLRRGYLRPSAYRWFGAEDDQPTLFDDSNIDNPVGRERDQAMSLLRLADLGIEDVVISTHEFTQPGSGKVQKERTVRLLHKSSDESLPLDFRAESEGTKVWFNLIGPVLTALQSGSMLVFDELDASLHPALSAELVRVFHSPETNPHGAQLIFTSHDTSLLNHLNRDEVWLTEKQSDGSTRLGALADFAGERVRKSQNLENAYLHGRFGALPAVDQTDFLRSLGLIG